MAFRIAPVRCPRKPLAVSTADAGITGANLTTSISRVDTRVLMTTRTGVRTFGGDINSHGLALRRAAHFAVHAPGGY